jgi:hypothetical protein
MLIYYTDVNLLRNNINIIKKCWEALSDAITEVGLEVNTDKEMTMLNSRHQNAGTNQRKNG